MRVPPKDLIKEIEGLTAQGHAESIAMETRITMEFTARTGDLGMIRGDTRGGVEATKEIAGTLESMVEEIVTKGVASQLEGVKLNLDCLVKLAEGTSDRKVKRDKSRMTVGRADQCSNQRIDLDDPGSSGDFSNKPEEAKLPEDYPSLESTEEAELKSSTDEIVTVTEERTENVKETAEIAEGDLDRIVGIVTANAKLPKEDRKKTFETGAETSSVESNLQKKHRGRPRADAGRRQSDLLRKGPQ